MPWVLVYIYLSSKMWEMEYLPLTGWETPQFIISDFLALAERCHVCIALYKTNHAVVHGARNLAITASVLFCSWLVFFCPLILDLV
ncbi:hypothetical protein L1049_005496 [Liquidambar formosana]|uniref:Uncharacterized protein n=1 Tax=Liquidambar formosana TaxID=63359 RepID=A0AAP0RVU1_LIQFO